MFFDVALEIHGVPLRIHGFSVIAGGGKLRIKAPRYRDEMGRWTAAVTLPPELAEALSKLAIEQLGLNCSLVIGPAREVLRDLSTASHCVHFHP